MECADYERLIHLSRDGERTEEEDRGLARHLQSCPRCAELQRQMGATEAYIERLRSLRPAVPHPESLTDRILAATRAAQPGSARRGTLRDALYAILMRPTIRYAYAATVALAVGFFLYQQASLVVSLQALERRMEGRDRVRPRPSVTYTVSSESLRRTGVLGALRPLLDPGDYRLTNGELSVKKDSLESYATGANLQQLRRLASAYGIDIPDVRVESLVDELKRSAVVQLKLDAEGG